MSFLKLECEDTKRQRILFGLLRKVYNSFMLDKPLNGLVTILPKTLFANTARTSQMYKSICETHNQEKRLAKKKRGNLPSERLVKSTITVRSGVATFKFKDVDYSLTLKDRSALKDGIYTETFLSWSAKTPIIEVNVKRVRNFNKALSKKVQDGLIMNKFKKDLSSFQKIKSVKIRRTRELFNKLGETSKVFLDSYIETEKFISASHKKIKMNLISYIEELNKNYTFLKVKTPLAKSKPTVLNDEISVEFFDLINLSLLSDREEKEFLKIFSR